MSVQRAFEVSLENTVEDAWSRAHHLDVYGTVAEWEEAFDRAERLQWFYEQWAAIMPGAFCCEHGMSAQNCYGPAHYASSGEIRAGW